MGRSRALRESLAACFFLQGKKHAELREPPSRRSRDGLGGARHPAAAHHAAPPPGGRNDAGEPRWNRQQLTERRASDSRAQARRYSVGGVAPRPRKRKRGQVALPNASSVQCKDACPRV